MSLEFTGKVTHVVPYDGTSKWVCTSFRLEAQTEDRYPNSMSFNLWNDKIDLADEFEVGDTLYVQYNAKCKVDPSGRLWNGLSCWSLLNETREAVRRQGFRTRQDEHQTPARQPTPPRIGMTPPPVTRNSWEPHDTLDDDVPF